MQLARTNQACPICILLWCAIAGCGGGDVAPAVVTHQDAEPAQQNDRIERRQQADEEKKKAEAKEEDLNLAAFESADPKDIFEVAENNPNAEIVGRVPEVAETDKFAIVRPKPEINSSSFEVIETTRPASRTTNQFNSDLQLPRGFVPISDAGLTKEGMPLRIAAPPNGSKMAFVPAGEFEMGRDNDATNAGPQHRISLGAFYIDVAEVTVAEYEQFRSSMRGQKRHIPNEPLNAKSPGDFPVMGVKWLDARAFASWCEKDLPTEAEWEKSARGPNGFSSPWGNGRAIWGRTRTLEQIDPVNTHPLDRSVYGVLDLAGNAREWCLDWYSDNAHQQAVDAGFPKSIKWKGPTRASPAFHRVVKGNGPKWKLWHRGGVDMRQRPANVGFRCVWRVEG